MLTRLVIQLCTWVYWGYLLMNSKVTSFSPTFYIECNLFYSNQLPFFSDMQFSFFLFSGYVGVSLLSPVMHNLWIWRVWSFRLIYIFKWILFYSHFQIDKISCYPHFLNFVMKLAGHWERKLLFCYCNCLCLLTGYLSLLVDIHFSSPHVNYCRCPFSSMVFIAITLYLRALVKLYLPETSLILS